MCDLVYIINWEIVRSGRIREKCFLEKEEFEDFLKVIIESKEYKLLEAYKLDLEEER